jgi:GDP-4-dehydro-6-deoxy-D-mannose reductase
MENKTIVITGSKGFIGRHLSEILSNTFPAIKIVGVDRKTFPENSENFAVNLLEPDSTFQIIDKIRPNYIFHLAGEIYTKDWGELYRSNVETTINIMEAVKQTGTSCRVVIPGSAAEYGCISGIDLPISEKQIPNPVVPYGVAKVWQTTVAKYYVSLGVNVVIGRLFNIIGPGAPEGLSIGAFASQLGKIKRGEMPPNILVGNLKSKRDFIDIIDACLGLLALATKGKNGEIYNICSGRSFSMERVLQMMIDQAGLDVRTKVDLLRVKGEDIGDIFGDNEKIKSDTGWSQSIQLAESIDAIANYVKDIKK